MLGLVQIIKVFAALSWKRVCIVPEDPGAHDAKSVSAAPSKPIYHKINNY